MSIVVLLRTSIMFILSVARARNFDEKQTSLISRIIA